jgi:L-amino acid N-acyltransferase YncA
VRLRRSTIETEGCYVPLRAPLVTIRFMDPDRRIRLATPRDAAACLAIYTPYVNDTVITFETEVPTEATMAARIESALAHHSWLVLEEGDVMVGYAYAHAFAERAAYGWSCESSIYLTSGLRRTGAGRALYTELFDRLEARGYRRVFAGVALPNEASLGIHRSFGFEQVGTFERVGWKHGAWHDVAWLQRDLGAGDPSRPPMGSPG